MIEFFSLLFLSAWAADKPVCDSAVVTRNCEFFKERITEYSIPLEDGSYILNPLYKPPTNGQPSYQGSGMQGGLQFGGGYGAMPNDKELLAKADIIDALENAKGLSTPFKMEYAENAKYIGLQENQKFRVPWPANQKGATYQLVDVKDVQAFLKNAMASEAYESLQKKEKVLRDLIQPALVAKQKEMAQKALEEKEAEAKRKALYEKRTAQIKAKHARIQELFKYAQEKIVQVITRGKLETDPSLTEEQKSLIRKIQTVQLTPLDDPRTEQSSHCANGASNAYYDRVSHDLSLCPGKLGESDASIISTIAHELGHSIDPCGAQMTLSEVDQAKLTELKNNPALNDRDKEFLDQNIQPNTRFVNFDLNLVSADGRLEKLLTSSGVLKKTASGVAHTKYPFKQEYNCLVEKNYLVEAKPADISHTIDLLKGHISSASPSERKLFERTLVSYRKAFLKYPQCLQTLGPSSKMTESMSDVLRAVVLEKHIADHPFKDEAEKVAAVPFAHFRCNGKDPGKTLKTSPKIISPILFSGVISSTEFRDTHATDSQRVEKMILNLPGMAKNYDCQRKAAACFDHLSLAARVKTETNKTSEQKSQR